MVVGFPVVLVVLSVPSWLAVEVVLIVRLLEVIEVLGCEVVLLWLEVELLSDEEGVVVCAEELVDICDVDTVEDMLVEIVVVLVSPRSWKGRASAEPARAAVMRANEKCMLNAVQLRKGSDSV